MEERNVARLSLVLALNRIPAGMVGWSKTVQIDHLSPISVTCSTRQNQGVPHGIDGDVLFALTTLYFLQGQ
ncbi:hypothetical protein LAJ19_14150 (plasmid) [Deinococcus taeanensis]|uniref:hypothetical protein n=1 Tax=Deinococcus taeanensis TaxID=2737050 RepID=UPI001CDBD393|nr:hypothetical protein [Deinococcus taeanensis]UBV44308.1 hypothetical protein LAJ19_14150 [Deinococcus taeanensis]